MSDIFPDLRRYAEDPDFGWSLGIFGAIAEFMRAADEPARLQAEDGRMDVVTGRGGLRILSHPSAQLVAYEMPSRHPERRVRALAACLPAAEAVRAGRTTLTEIGPDADALRDEDRAGILFDLGIGLGAVEACIRASQPVLVDALRRVEGRPLFEAGDALAAILEHAPHRVFISTLGRIEVYQPIPPADGRSPEGPHTHVLPKLLAHRRTHAANVPIPEGWVPCLSLHPPRADGSGRA